MSEFNIADHFVEVNKTVEMPSKPRKIGFADLNKTKTKLDSPLTSSTKSAPSPKPPKRN